MPEQSTQQFIGQRVIEAPPIPKFCENARMRRFSVGPYPWLACENCDGDGTALLFFGPGVARRVRNYPEQWYDLSDEALYALSWSR